jgi:hypothetical protein
MLGSETGGTSANAVNAIGVPGSFKQTENISGQRRQGMKLERLTKFVGRIGERRAIDLDTNIIFCAYQSRSEMDRDECEFSIHYNQSWIFSMFLKQIDNRLEGDKFYETYRISRSQFIAKIAKDEKFSSRSETASPEALNLAGGVEALFQMALQAWKLCNFLIGTNRDRQSPNLEFEIVD